MGDFHVNRSRACSPDRGGNQVLTPKQEDRLCKDHDKRERAFLLCLTSSAPLFILSSVCSAHRCHSVQPMDSKENYCVVDKGIGGLYSSVETQDLECGTTYSLMILCHVVLQ